MSDNCKHDYQYVQGRFQCDKCGHVADNGNAPPIKNSNFSRNAVIIGAICITGIVGVSLGIMTSSDNVTESTSESILDGVTPTIFPDPIYRYVVIDDNYDYESVAKSAIYDWAILNPDLKFEKVDNNYTDIDFKIVYRDYESRGDLGCFGDCAPYLYYDDTGKIMNVLRPIYAETFMPSTLLIDTKVRDCQGRSQQYTHATIKDTTKWAIGSYLELGNHTDVNHLMYNEDPNAKIPFDDLGYNIPDGIDVFYTIEGLESEIELAKLEDQINELEIKLSSYPEVMEDNSQYAQYERQYDEYEKLFNVHSDGVEHYNCLVADEPEYDGIYNAMFDP